MKGNYFAFQVEFNLSQTCQLCISIELLYISEKYCFFFMMYRCLQRRSPVEGHLVVVPMLILKKQHILDNFSTLPKVDDLCNRHILYLYITSGECSRAKTERQLRAHFPSIYAEQGSNTLNNAIKRTVSQTIDNKLKKTQ